VRIAERIEQAIKMGKIRDLAMVSRTMIRDKSEDGSQLGNFCTSGLIIASSQMPLSKIDISLSLEFVYQHLLSYGLIALTPSNPMQPSFPRWYDPDQRCECHSDVLGHSIENYKNFKYQVRKMVSKGKIEFVRNGGTYHIINSIFNNNQ